MRPMIHRADTNAGPLCGEPGIVRISMTGVMLTCPRCIELSKPPSREDAMRQLTEAAERFRAHERA